MKPVEKLVPKNIFDFSGIEELKILSDEEIEPVIPELLAWMKDMNWPIAKEMPSLLAKHTKLVVPHIIEILQPEQMECDWKSSIIYNLLPLLDVENLLMIRPTLVRITANPTWGEKSDKTNIATEEILKENGWEYN